ncbi:MAG: tetratricopeptide repeat protein [Cyanobacteria bacterium J06621_12]
MTIKEQNQNAANQIEELHAQAVLKHKQNQLDDALSFYLRSIEIDELQCEWIYANAITISAQIEKYDVAQKLTTQAHQIYSDSDEIFRASGIFFHRVNQVTKAIASFQRAIDLERQQPEWVYAKLIELLVRSKLYDRAAEVYDLARQQFPETAIINHQLELEIAENKSSFCPGAGSVYKVREREQVLAVSPTRETPASIENNINLDISKLRRRLTDSAIIERHLTLLNQLLFEIAQGKKEMNVDALVHCLAEMKTDIHYLKTKMLNSPVENVDPQAGKNVELENIVGLLQPILIKCELKERIVGSGWYDPEEHGRWSGPGTVSSIVLPYPVAGSYKFEMVVRAEAKPNLLQSLKINVNNQELETSTIQGNSNVFPAVVTGELEIPQDRNQSFLAIDLVIDETSVPLETDSRLIGLLIERISLIPNLTAAN